MADRFDVHKIFVDEFAANMWTSRSNRRTLAGKFLNLLKPEVLV